MGAAKRRKAEIDRLKQTPKPKRIGRPEARAKAVMAMVDVLGDVLHPLLRK